MKDKITMSFAQKVLVLISIVLSSGIKAFSLYLQGSIDGTSDSLLDESMDQSTNELINVFINELIH